MNYPSLSNLLEKLTKSTFLVPLLVSVGIIGLYFSTIIRNPYTILYPLALIVSPIMFYFLNIDGGLRDIKSRSSHGKYILFAFFMLLLILLIQYYMVGFQRTAGTIYITVMLYILAGSYILTEPRPSFGLVILLIVGTSNRMTAYYGSALYNGVDIYSHSRWTQSIAADGSLDILATSQYFYSPFYHILGAVGEVIYSVPTRDAISLSTLLAVTVLPTLAVYLITVHFWRPQIGLVGGLLYLASDHAIRWGIHVIPTSLGIAFFSLLMVSLIKYVGGYEKRQYLLTIIFMFAIMFTHQVSLFIGITAIGAFAIITIVYQRKSSHTAINLIIISILTMIFDFLVTRYRGPDGSSIFFDVVLSSFITSLTTAGTETRVEITFPQDPSISPTGAAALTLPQVAGSAILLTVAVIGALYWLSERRSKRELFIPIALSITVTVLFTVTLGGPVIGLRNLLPGRWWPFTYIILSVLAAPGLLALVQSVSSLVSGDLRKANFDTIFILFILFLVPYIVFMGGNFAGASDSPLLSDAPGAEKMKISDSEKHLFEHAVEYESELEIMADRRAESVFSRYYATPVQTLSVEYGEPNSMHQPSIIINREYIHTKNSQYVIRIEEQQFVAHGSFPLEEVPNSELSRTYSNGKNSMYLYSD